MRKINTVEIVWEVGDTCYSKLHKQEARILFMVPDERKEMLIQHTSQDRYLEIVTPDEVSAEPIKAEEN